MTLTLFFGKTREDLFINKTTTRAKDFVLAKKNHLPQ